MKYSDVQYKKFDSPRRFGVEFEVGCSVKKIKIRKTILGLNSGLDCRLTKYQLTGDDGVWHVKDDASCGPKGRSGPNGVEIASFVGRGKTDLDRMAEVAESLKKIGCEVNENCGFHIHAEGIDLNPIQIGVLYSYWLKLEPIISLALPSNRIENPFCRSLLGKIGIADSVDSGVNFESTIPGLFLYDLLRPKNLKYYENDDRRVNFNLVNYARAEHFGSNHRKTLELRWPEGTLESLDVKSWVIIFIGFIDTCSRLNAARNLGFYTKVTDAFSCFGLNHKAKGKFNSMTNTFHLYDDDLLNARIWFLQRICKYAPLRIKEKTSLDEKIIQKILKSAEVELKKIKL